MKRITLNLHDEQTDALQKRADETGVLVSKQIRRAISLVLFADKQSARESSRQPVLIEKQERR